MELYIGLMRNIAALFSKTPLKKLFGMTSDNENDDNSFVLKLNLLTTAYFAKYYLYYQKLHSEPWKLDQFIPNLKKTLRIEK